jgi:hypothetical protein
MTLHLSQQKVWRKFELKAKQSEVGSPEPPKNWRKEKNSVSEGGSPESPKKKQFGASEKRPSKVLRKKKSARQKTRSRETLRKEEYRHRGRFKAIFATGIA